MSCCEWSRLGITNSFQLMEATRADVFHVLSEGKLEKKVTPASHWHFLPAKAAVSCEGCECRCPSFPTWEQKGERECTNPRVMEVSTLLFHLMYHCLHPEWFLQRAGKLLFKENKSISQHLRKTGTTSLRVWRRTIRKVLPLYFPLISSYFLPFAQLWTSLVLSRIGNRTVAAA